MGILFNDVVINKRSGGLGRRTPDQDMVSGLLFNGADVVVTDDNDVTRTLLEDAKLYRLASIDDAEALGITENYDKDGESAYYQISQFFRMNPSGDLFIYKRESVSPFADLVKEAEAMLVAADGQIRQLAVTYNKDINFDQTINAARNAKGVTERAFENNRPVEIFIEGKGFDATGTFENLPDEVGGANVSIMVAMDNEIAVKPRYFNSATGELYTLKQDETVDGDGNVTSIDDPNTVTVEVDIDTKAYSNTAAVGVLLGAVSRAKVSENIAWIEKFNLTGEGFRSVGFVKGKELPTEGAQRELDRNKYIFTRKHTGIPGVYFNDSHTCINAESDFTFIEANRTINKAARIARTALLPKVNAPVLVDPDTGKLPPSTIKGYESLCRSALERMISNEEVSEIDVFVDPNQDILADSILKVKVEVIPMGTARRIVVDLGFKNPFGLNA